MKYWDKVLFSQCTLNVIDAVKDSDFFGNKKYSMITVHALSALDALKAEDASKSSNCEI